MSAITSVPIVATVRQGTIRGVRTITLVWLPETPDAVTMRVTGPCGERTYEWERVIWTWMANVSARNGRESIGCMVLEDPMLPPMSITMPLDPVARMLAAVTDELVADLMPDLDGELAELLGSES